MSESDDDRRARLARERLEAIQRAKKEGRLGPSSTPAPKPKKSSTPQVRAIAGQQRRRQIDNAVDQMLGLRNAQTTDNNNP